MRNGAELQMKSVTRARLAAAARRATPAVEPVERRVLMSATPGSLDAAFGDGGEVVASNGATPAYATAVATLPGGDVVVARGTGSASTVTRLTPSGSADREFGNSGTVTVAFAPSKVFVLANGNILLAGTELEELTPTGSISAAYGTNGVVSNLGTGAVGDVTVGPDGSAYVVENGYFVAKYTPAGAIDTTYGSDGQATLQIGPHTLTTTAALAVDGNGTVTAGVGTDVPVGGHSYGYAAVRLSADGTASRSISLGGFTSTATPVTTTAVVLGPDGTAYVGAYQGSTDVVGVVSPSFASQGSDSLVAAPAALAVQSDGKVIAVGSNVNAQDGKPDQVVERLTPGVGGADPSFGTAGVVDLRLGTTLDAAQSVALDADGDILFAGDAATGPTNSYTLAALVGGPGAVAGVLANGVLTVTGTAGADKITLQETQALQYTVTVNGASQVFDGPISHVIINAGDGNDTVGVSTFIQGGEPDVSVSGGAGDDYLSAYGNNNVTLDGGDGNDTLAGSSTEELPVTMLGGAGNDTFEIQDDVAPVISGGDGNDILVIGGLGATDPVSFAGGAGNDTLEVDAISHNGGATSFNLDGKADSTIGFGGPSTFGADIEDVTIGNANSTNYGAVSVTGDAPDNVITVNASLYGATVHGGDGNDTLSVIGGENSAIYGDGGNDTIVGGNGGPGVNTISGGAGTDTVDYSAQTGGVNVYLGGGQLSGTAGNIANGYGDKLDGTVEVVDGGSGNDLLVAAPGGGDALYGNGGNDTLTAQGGPDSLYGGDGNDAFNARDGGTTTIDGGAGTDTATVDATGDTTLNVETVIPPTTTPTSTRLTGTTSGTAGSFQNNGNTVAKATDGNLSTYFDGPTANGDIVVIDLGSAKSVSQIKYAPRSTYASRMVGGVFQASNSATFASGVVNVYTVSATPAVGALTTVTPSTTTAYRYWRYVAPNGSYGNIAEFELFGSTASTPTQLAGTTSGTAGSYQSDGDTVALATDGNPSTYFDGPTANGDVVVIDLGSAKAVAQIKYAPRSTYASRMVGGVFQASNSATFAAGVVNVYTITATPAVGVLTAVTPSTTTAYRYWRYVAPNGSYGNIAEFQLFGATTSTPTLTLRTGTTTGTAGSFQSDGNTVAEATDGSLTTYFDGPAASGDVVELDLGSAMSVSQIRYAPRGTYASRMVGGVFQASNTADFSSGVVKLYTVTSTPPAGSLTTVTLSSPVTYRYYRYVAPANSYGNIAEFQLFG